MQAAAFACALLNGMEFSFQPSTYKTWRVSSPVMYSNFPILLNLILNLINTGSISIYTLPSKYISVHLQPMMFMQQFFRVTYRNSVALGQVLDAAAGAVG